MLRSHPAHPTAVPRAERIPTDRRTPGFTLVEVLVSLLVAGIMVLLAHGIFAAAVSGSRRIESARHSLDREQGRHQLLTAAFLSLEIGHEEAGFDGRPQELSFVAWLPTGDGWFERRQIALTVKDGRLLAAMPPASPLVLLDSVATVYFDYLLEPGADARWVQEWVSPVSAPLAVRIRLKSDTTVYLIKARG